MYPKSTSCKGKNSGTFLNEYHSQSEAQGHADHLNNDSVAYKCTTCKKWHLSPKSRATAKRTNRVDCGCRDSIGRKKDLYIQQHDAIRRSEIIGSEKGIALSIYKCPKNKGWHLSKGR